MAIKPIEEMTRPVSRREEKMAMSDPDPMGEAYDFYKNMYDDMLERNQLPKGIKTFEDFMDEIDMLDISPNDFTKRKQPEGVMQLASFPFGFPGREEDMREKALDWYVKTIGPLYDEDGIPQADIGSIIDAYLNRD
jgi:hypothetical protein|tara:strand:+ start:300 stop:707 length:408 start_codon:yes stop_codon:yes gene_type:complete